MSATVVRLIVCALVVAAVARPLHGQTVRGQVVDSITRAPVSSGFVVLIDANGNEIKRVLTTWDGRFTVTLQPDIAAPWRLRSERIGYRVAATDWFRPPADSSLELTIWVQALPTPLSAIEVSGSTDCDVRPDQDEQTAIVWEEARKALAAAAWTESRQAYQVVSNVYERDLGNRRRRILREQHRAVEGLTTNPFVSPDPDALMRDGYVGMEGTAVSYYAPDAVVLQDEGFLSTHCFRLRRPDNAGDRLIGLAFEPAPSRNLPDVEGVLWLDEETSALRSLEYQYTNLPRDLRTGADAGGTVDFLALPSGDWIVSRWRIEIPTAFRQERVNPFARGVSWRIDTIRDTGGEVLAVTDTSGARVYEAELAEIVGVVVDNSSNDAQTALAAATVEIAETWFSTTTNDRGAFRLVAPLEGEHDVIFSHARIDSLAFAPPAYRVTLKRGHTDTLWLTVPPMRDILASHCPDGGLEDTGRVLVGRVQDSLGAPVQGVDVIASWQESSPQPGDEDSHTTTRTDDDGTYALCDFEAQRPAIVYAVGNDRYSEFVPVAFDSAGVRIGTDYYNAANPIWRRNLTVTTSEQSMVVGMVSDSTTGRPVAGALVTIDGAGIRDATDSAGMFRLRGVPPGTQRLTLRRPGYSRRWGDVEVYDDQPTIIGVASLRITPAAQMAGILTESETGRPVADAWVTLISDQGDSVAMSRSDDSGEFLVTAPEPGLYHVAARRIGYGPGTTGFLELFSGRLVEATLRLDRLTMALDPVTVLGKPAVPFLATVGFYDRQRASFGVFLDREAIEQQAGASELGHLLQRIPGIRVDLNGRIRLRGVGTGAAFGPCGPPLVWVDGFRIEPAEDDDVPAIISPNEWQRSIHPANIEAIEVYRTPAEVPAQYNTGGQAGCGVILIWTRRGGY